MLLLAAVTSYCSLHAALLPALALFQCRGAANSAPPLLPPPAARRSRDVLVLCGDISDELGALEAALSLLASKFMSVFYVPGAPAPGLRVP